MKNTHLSIKATGTLALVVAASLFVQSCIDERYDLGRGISTTMTFGGDSLAVPLGKTDTIRLGDFLDSKDVEMLKTMENGGYALTVNDSIFVEVSKIDRSALNITGQSFKQEKKVSFGDISLEKFSIPGLSIESDINLAVDKISLGDFTLPSKTESKSFGAGLSGYALTDLTIDNINETGNTEKIFTNLTLPSYGGIPSVPIRIEDESSMPVDFSQSVDYSVNVPAGVTGISNVLLKDIPAANFTVNIQLVGATGVLTTGKIIPNLSIDPSSLFEFTDLPTGIIRFGASDSMTVKNGFSISKNYTIGKLIIDENPVGRVLSVSRQVKTDGSVHMDDVYALSDKINKVKDLYVRVTISVENMVIKSMDFAVPPVRSTLSGSMSLNIDNGIPSDILKVNTVYFDESNHKISITISPNNLPSGINSQLNIDSLILHFPPEFKLKPTTGLAGNTYTLKNVALSSTGYFNKDFDLESFNLSKREIINNKLEWAGSVSYAGGVSISFPNKINSSNIPPSENDPKIGVSVRSGLTFESADIVTNNKDISISRMNIPLKLSANIADQVKRLDTIKLASNTMVRLRIIKPDLPLKLAGNDLLITFPPQFSFHPALLNNTYIIRDTVPDLIELELKSLNICKNLTNGSLELDTVIQVGGMVRLRSGSVNTKQVETLSNENMQIQATSDNLTITSTSLKLNALSTSYSDSTILDLPTIDLPEEIVSLDSILLADGAKIDLNIDVTNMPRLDKPLVADIELFFPSILRFAPGEADHANRVVIHQPFVGDKLSKTIHLKGLQFDGMDLNGILDINEKVRYRVEIKVDETTVNSEELTDNPINVLVNVKLSDINFESVYGRVNPGIDPIRESLPLSGLPSFMKGDDVTLDITKPVITLQTTCNLGLPIFVDLDLRPSRKGVILNEAAQTVRFRMPKSPSPSTHKTTRLWIAPDSAGKPQEYVFVQADIQKLFKTIPDDIEIEIKASADINEQHYINLLADYSMDVKYDVTVPFAFGEELNVPMKRNIMFKNSMIGESTLSGKSLELLGSFQNSIPLELELELIPLDADSVPLDVVPARQLISAGAKDGSATTSNLTIKLDDPNGQLKNLRGFCLSFKASSNSTVAGTPIRPDNFIIAELKARLNGGITIGGNNK